MVYRELLRLSWAARRGHLTPTRADATRRARRPGTEQAPRSPSPPQRLRHELFELALREVETETSDALAERGSTHTRVRGIVEQALLQRGLSSVSPQERAALEDSVVAELIGFGPLEPLMRDATVSDILVNGPHDVWVDRFGRLERTSVSFDDDQHVMRLLSRLVAAQGRHLEEATPYVDVRLPDGSRLHATIPPISSVGPVLAIRRSRADALHLDQLYACGTLTPRIGRFLASAVRAGMSVLICGGAASGKTTLLNVISQFIPDTERVVTIEETAELRLRHPHVVTLEARQPNIEGRGAVNLRTLVRNALRLRADRIIVGEVRGSEVFDMLQAMNVGHNGSLTTVHANNPQDALRRLETLALVAGLDAESGALRELLAAAFDVIIHMTRFADGTRRITAIGEVKVVGDGNLGIHDLFRFETAASADAHPRGRHVATGQVPDFLARLSAVDPGIECVFDMNESTAGDVAASSGETAVEGRDRSS